MASGAANRGRAVSTEVQLKAKKERREQEEYEGKDEEDGRWRYGEKEGDLVRFRRLQRHQFSVKDADVDEVRAEPKMEQDHVTFPNDGRCDCCPYGYHIDLDFLRYLSSLSTGELSEDDRKKMRLNKKKLRKSMEFFLQQQELARKSSMPIGQWDSGQLQDSSNEKSRPFEVTTRHKDTAMHSDASASDAKPLLDEFEKAIGVHLASVNLRPTVFPETYSRNDGMTTSLSYEEDMEKKFRTEAEFILSRPIKSPPHATMEYDSCSSLSTSSGPPSPSVCQLSPVLKAAAKAAKESESRQRKAKAFVNSSQLARRMASLLPEADRSADVRKRDVVSGQSRSVDPQMSPTDPVSMTTISSSMLQAIREQMSVSLERMRELEEEVKMVHVLQVHMSILKEEKQQFAEQLKTARLELLKRHNLEASFCSPDCVNGLSYSQSSAQASLGMTCQSESLLDHGNLFADSATKILLHERELNTEEYTELLERETKTVFLGSDSSSEFSSAGADVKYRSKERPKVPPKPKITRDIGVGTDPALSVPRNVEVHERELRTVYIGDAQRHPRSIRNVGIMCRAAMRDVGVMHLNENERPMTRTIGVGVGELGLDCLEGQRTQSTEFHLHSTSGSNTFTAASESKRIHIRNDQLRSVLDEMLRKTVHSVAVQCRFPTVDKGVEAVRVGPGPVDVGCGQDSVDVDVVPKRIMRSVAIDNRPSVLHKASCTDLARKVDSSTNTTTHQLTTDSSTTTDNPEFVSTATSTDVCMMKTAATEIDSSLLSIHAYQVGTNTEITEVSSVAISTELTGEVEKPALKAPSVSQGTSTVHSSFLLRDIAVNTDSLQLAEKETATWNPSSVDRSCNTDSLVVISSSANTEKVSCVSRAVGDALSIFGVPESEFGDFTTETAKESRPQVRQVPNVTPLATSCRSSSIISNGETSRQQRGTEEIDLRNCSGEICSDLDALHDEARDTQASKTDTFEKDSAEHFKIPLPSTNDTAVTSALEGPLGMRHGEVSFSFPEQVRNEKEPLTASPTEMEHLRLLELDRSCLPYSESLLWASDDSASTQSSVIDRSTLSWSWGRNSGDKELMSAAYDSGNSRGGSSSSIPKGRLEGKDDNAQHKRSSDLQVTENKRRRGTEWRTPDDEQQLSLYGEANADLSSDLDLLIDCLHVSVAASRGAENSACLRVSPTSNDDAMTDDVAGETAEPRTQTMTRAVFKTRNREVTSSLADDEAGILRDDDWSISAEWPSGTSVFSSEAIDDAVSPKDFSLSSAVDEEDDEDDVELPVAGEPNHQNLRAVDGESHMERQHDGKEQAEETEEPINGSISSGIIRSIMKPMSTGRREKVKGRKELTFSDGVIIDRYSPAGEEEPDSESDGSKSSLSFDEGTYDSRLGEVIYTCGDDGRDDDRDDDVHIDTDGFTDDAIFEQEEFEFSDQNLRDIYELSEEMVTACTTYAGWLENRDVSEAVQNSSYTVIQREWFSSSSLKLADPSKVEDYLTQINEISHKLLKVVVNMTDSSGNTVLHYAISHGNIEIVNIILDTGICDVDKRNRAGYNAIMLASLSDVHTERQRDVIRRLFDKGDVNQRALQAGQTALMLAVSHGDPHVVRMLLEAGAEVNMQDEEGSTALMCASEHGHLEMVRLLLAQQDCDASLVDNDGSTAVSVAMEAGHREIGILLYAHLNFKPTSPVASQRNIKKRTNGALPSSSKN